jgi:hypothetical protein
MATKKDIEAAVVAAGFTKADLPKVMEALAEATTDPAVGQVIRNPATGDVALRVHQYAETYWRVYSTADRTWIEQELVGWDVLHEAAAVVTTPGEAAVDPVEADDPAEKTK